MKMRLERCWAKAAGAVATKEAANKLTSGVVQGIMSSRSMADTAVSAKQRGLTDKQAFSLGVVSAAAEAITEKYSLDAIFDSGKTGWKYVLQNVATEGSEEAASNAINFIADVALSKDKSEWRQNVTAYRERGYTKGEAFGKAFGNQLLSMGTDALAGMISGGVISGSVNIVNSMAVNRANRAEENEMVQGLEKWLAKRKTNSENTKQFSVVGETEDGRRIYKTNYPKGTPKAVKQKDVIQMVQNIWSKKPIELTIMNEETGEAEIITAEFNPELSERSDLSKIAFGNRKGTGSEKRMTLDLAPDFYQIAQDAKHTSGKAETGKDNPAHDDVKRWEYFVTNLVYEDEQGVQIDAHMNIDVKRTSNGEFFYSFGMEKGTAPQTLLAVVDENVSPTVPNESIPQTTSSSQENNNKSFAISRMLPRAGESGPILPTAKEEMEARERQRRANEAATETERTGILYGAARENIEMAGRISKAIGRDVVFYENAESGVENDDGYYDGRDGKIHINAKSKNALPRIIAHEMTHSVELADSYIDLFRTVIRRIQKTGGSIQEMRNEIKTRYENNGVKLSHNAQIDVEIMAEYIAENLLTDEASIASLAKESPKSARGILRFLDSILAKLGNTNAQERVFVAKARALYAKALGETQSTVEAESERMRTGSRTEATPAKTETSSETARERHPIIRENVLPTAAERFGNRAVEAKESDNPSGASHHLPLHKGGEVVEVRAEEGDMAEDKVANNTKPWYNKRKKAKISKLEYARISSAIMQKNAGKQEGELPEVDYVYAADNFYVYANHAIGEFSVLQKFDTETEREKIDAITRWNKNEDYRNAIELTSAFKGKGQDGRRGGTRHNVNAGDGGTYTGNGGVLNRKSERNPIGRPEEGNGNQSADFRSGRVEPKGMAEVEAIVLEKLRPEIAENAELMEMLRAQFGADGTEALARQIKAEVERTGTVGRFGVLFSDGGMAVEEALGAGDVSNGGERQFSISKDEETEGIFSAPQEVTEKLSAQVDAWLQGGMRSDEHFDFGKTPEVLKQLGAQNLPIVMNQSVMVKITGGSHAIALDTIKDIPNAMADPVMIFKSDTVKNAFVVLTEHDDKSGDAVVVALHLNREEKHIRVNRVASIYGKENVENFIQKQTTIGNLKYIDKNKSQVWSQSRGLQLPKLADTNPDNNIILYKENVVNRYRIKKSGKYAQNVENKSFSISEEQEDRRQYSIGKEKGVAKEGGKRYNKKQIRMNSQEHTLVKSAIMKKESGRTDGDVPTVDSVYAYDKYYLYEPTPGYDGIVFARFDPIYDQRVINEIEEGLKSGTIRDKKALSGRIKDFRSGKRFGVLHNGNDENGRTSDGTTGIHGSELGSNDVGYSGSGIRNQSGIGLEAETDERQYAITKKPVEAETAIQGETEDSADFWDEWLEKVKEYGAMEKGEKPARDIEVPKKIGKNKPVSQTVRTILEAKVTPDEAIPTIEQMVLDGEFSYDVHTDKKAIKEADGKIEKRGYIAAYDAWAKDMDAGKVSKENTALGWALYNQAATSGDIKTATTILNKMVQHQRNAAQALQATRILKQLSPEGQLYQAVNAVEALQQELKEKYGDKAPDLKIDENLAKEFLEARTQKERDEIKKKIYRDIGRQMPSRFIDKWNAWRYLAMLGNPRTHIRNIVGNAGFAPVVAAKNLAATTVESIVYRVSGGKMGRTKAFIVGTKYDRDLLKAAWNDYKNVAEMISNGGKYSDAAMANRSIEEGRRVFKFVPLEAARKGNSWLLEAEDVWFSKPHYAYALAQYCKANHISLQSLEEGKLLDAAVQPCFFFCSGIF